MSVLNMVGGGGAGVNYAVVGGTAQPASPKENMIWLNTSIAIPKGKVFFQSEQPEDTTAGAVWINIGANSIAPFTVLKKGDTFVCCPTKAQQYVSGAWADVAAQTYQDGAWHGWVLWLYDKGETYSNVTGGWTNVGGMTFALQSNQIFVQSSGGQYGASTGATANVVDLSGIRTLYFKTGTGGGTSGWAMIKNSRNYDDPTLARTSDLTGASTVYSLDVTSIDSGYIWLLATGMGAYISVAEIWGEP